MRKKPREQAIEELTLMLMYLNRFSDNNEYARLEKSVGRDTIMTRWRN